MSNSQRSFGRHLGSIVTIAATSAIVVLALISFGGGGSIGPDIGLAQYQYDPNPPSSPPSTPPSSPSGSAPTPPPNPPSPSPSPAPGSGGGIGTAKLQLKTKTTIKGHVLLLTVTTNKASRLTITIKGTGKTKPRTWTLRTSKGQKTLRITLPKSLKPGVYRLTVNGTAAGKKAQTTRTIKI